MKSIIKYDNFVNISSIYVEEINNFGDTTQNDPLAGTGFNEQPPKLYKLDNTVFAEPIQLTNFDSKDTDTATEDAIPDEFVFYDNVIVQMCPGKRRKYHYDIKNEDSPTCPQSNCKKRFTSKNLLKAHVRKVHCAERDKFQCGSCEASFPLKYLLVRHRAVHENTKRECMVCHKLLSIRTSLSQHMRSHDERKAYSCATCGKSFLRRATLVTHARFVHRKGEFVCDKCHVKFKKRNEYQRHLRDVHVKERHLACEECGRMVSTFAALGAHKAKKHAVLSDADGDLAT